MNELILMKTFKIIMSYTVHSKTFCVASWYRRLQVRCRPNRRPNPNCNLQNLISKEPLQCQTQSTSIIGSAALVVHRSFRFGCKRVRGDSKPKLHVYLNRPYRHSFIC